MIKKALKYLFVALFWLGLWQLVSMLIGKELLFPSPIAVAKRLLTLMSTSAFYLTVGHSLLRILVGLIIATVVGILLAMLTSAVPFLHDLLSPIMTVIKSTPVASFIVLLLLWVGRDIMPALISVLIILPVIWVNVETGIAQTDKSLLEMAKAYDMSLSARVRYIYLPSALPYFLSGLKSSLGMAWKAGIAAEVLALPVISIGKHIYEAKLYLETVDLFAWTAAVVIISLIIEKIFVFPIKRLSERLGGAK